MGWFKQMFRNWLQIVPQGASAVSIISDADFNKEAFRNKVWYRGNASELAQFYGSVDDLIGNKSFWAASGGNMGIRKIHSGLPALIVDTISDIAVNDLLGVRMSGAEGQEIWDAIAAENNFGRLLGRAVRKAVALGDGAFKISFDMAVSAYPIIEFFGADKLRFNYSRGRVTEVVFLQNFSKGHEHYTLEEIYRKDGIGYRLLNAQGNEVDLAPAQEMGKIAPIDHNVGMNLAIPLIFDENPKFEGRGKSIFDGKIGAFDALDEVLSQWVDALRDGRAQKYIPIGLLPRNPHDGRVMGLSAFESRFIQTEMDLAEGADNSIKVVQPHIDTAAMAESCRNFVTLALQGIIAPATLGIDTSRRDNAEAQREKEKATLYTRGKIIGVLRDVVGQLACASVAAYNAFYGNGAQVYTAKVEFGEYAAPNFESQIDTIGKGRQMGVISVENAVEQLYGNTWSEEQKEMEVKRLKEEEMKK
ncbi:MAG: phage portal protein [Defluviitaleaceae bacterium]|nr:phage portal protein [Defluviitaleaceae bacterium]